MIQNPFANMTVVVKNLLIINVIFYIATYVLGHAGIFDMEKWLAAYYPSSSSFRLWQIVSYMFMHSSNNIFHLLSNMLGLVMIGPLLEQTLGPKRFLSYYFLTGVGALLIQYIVQAVEMHNMIGVFYTTHPETYYNLLPYNKALTLHEICSGAILGASGAVFGLLIAIYLLYPDVEVYIYFIPIPVKIKYLVPVYVLFELYSGFKPSQGDSVAHFAHLGGAIVGFIVIKLWGLRKQDNFF